jgi:hypothetical protein
MRSSAVLILFVVPLLVRPALHPYTLDSWVASTRLEYDQIVPSCFPRFDGIVTCFANFDCSNVLGLHLGAFSMPIPS